jgi:hypothetical protein
VGNYGIDDGGTIKLAHSFASDWEAPQFDFPGRSGYTTITTTGEAQLRMSFHRKGHDRPWMKCLIIDVFDGSLVPGDTVTITLGDRSQGGPGMRAQTFQESAHKFALFIDPTNASVACPIAHFPTVAVVPGEVCELVCLLPSQAVVGSPVEVFLQGRDQWGNPTSAPAHCFLHWDGDGEAVLENGRLICRTPGTGWVIAHSGELTCRSNPITATAAKPPLSRYWGDLHAQSDATVGTGTEEEYFTFARDSARLDFCSHQGNDFQMTDDDWSRLNQAVKKYHEDDTFVVFPGYEWSGNTSAGGDRNVFYYQEGSPIIRSTHWQVPEVAEDELTPAHPINELFARLRQHVGIDNVLLGAHVGGRYADVRFFDEELGSLIELASCWGIFEWMLWDAFDKGYIVGVMCNSDGHKGRPGAEGPGAGEFGIANGLTCVLAESLTRRAVWNALKQRRCYGTTGPRIDLDFKIGGHPMGSVVQTAEPLPAQAVVRGTAPLASLTLYRGREAIQSIRPSAFHECHDSNRIRVSWGGSRMRSRGRRMQWDGVIRLSDASIISATPFQFDSILDGITAQLAHELAFKSQTSGDMDGIDLILQKPHQGTLTFENPPGRYAVALNQLTGESPHIFDCGGLDLQVRIERYPRTLTELSLELSVDIPPPPGEQTSPYFVKVVQEDGHMAWSSPIYLRGDSVSSTG